MARPIDIGARLGPLAARAVISGCATEADLAAALALPGLPVGARGLAEALARQLAAGAGVGSGVEGARLLDAPPGPPLGLFVIGTTDPITMRQVVALRAGSGLVHVAAPNGLPGWLLALQAPPSAAQVSARLASAVARHAALDVVELTGECLPGVVFSRVAGLTFVTRCGGFGEYGSLLRVARMIGARPE